MAGRFANKTIVVTGGSRGIGLGLARQFMQRPGNRVIITTRDVTKLSQDLLLLAGAGAPGSSPPMPSSPSSSSSTLEVMELDVSEMKSISAWAENLKGKVNHVDVLVNNAGIYGRRLPLEEFEPSDFLADFNINAMGPFFVVQQMLKQGLLGDAPSSSTASAATASPPPPLLPSSLIVNISSIIASHGDQTVSSAAGGGYAYRASKAALNIINKSLAKDLGPQGVECILIHPGYVATDMNAFKGWITVEESTSGIIKVLEDKCAALGGGGGEGGAGPGGGGEQEEGWRNHGFYSYDGSVIPW